MLELIAVQGRLAEEHAREVSKLQSVNAELFSQLSDLRSRMDDVTSHYEEASHLALVPNERCDSTNAKLFQDLHDKSFSHSTCPPDLSKDACAPEAAELLVPRGEPLSHVEVVVEDIYETLSVNVDADDDNEETHDCKITVGAMASVASVKRTSSAAALPATSTDSMASAAATPLSSMESATRQLSSPSKASTRTLSDRNERRALRLQTALLARLRAVWVLDESDSIVPRWSQSSLLTFSSDSEADPDAHATDKKPMTQPVRTTSTKTWSFKRTLSTVQHRNQCRACIVHPQSTFKAMVDLSAMLIMGYDFFMTPLMFFNLPDSDFTRVMGWTTRIFWTFDMWLNFHTAIYEKGLLVREFRPIAKKYLKTMFFPDLAIVIAEWISYILESTSQGSRTLENVYMLRILKGLRFAKIFRIFKFERIMQDFRAQINSTLLILWLRPLILVFFLLVFNHTLACFWYGIGVSSRGWTELEAHDDSFGYMYMTALHWAISQLHGNMEVFPQNMSERIFMCSNAIVALILYSTFLSSITNGMMEIRASQAELHARKSKVRACLARRHISLDLTMRIKNRLEYINNAKTGLDDEAATLSFLPKDLLMDLYEESRGPTVLHHTFFHVLSLRGPRIIRQLCHDSMSEASHMPDHIVFSTGDACPSMYFVTSGELLYEHRASSTRTISKQIGTKSEAIRTDISGDLSLMLSEHMGEPGQSVHVGSWLCEAALWMIWEYRGQLTVKIPALLLMVDALSFGTVLTQFHFARVNSKRYARYFVDRMVQHGLLTDVLKEDDDILSENSG